MTSSDTVALLDRDPDLGAHLDATAFAAARARVRARVLRYPRGPWNVGDEPFDHAGSLGLLVIEGLLVRKVSVGPRACAELLGPGDVTQPWLQVGPDASVSAEVDWDVAERVTIAVLDRPFAERAAPWPEITTAIARRIMTRTHWLAFHLAVCHIRRVDDRVLLVLWHLADRWGRVTPRGVEISIALPHWLIALMVGARRPAVSLALQDLVRAGAVERRARSRWVLHGSPPGEYRQLHRDAARRQIPSCPEPPPLRAPSDADAET